MARGRADVESGADSGFMAQRPVLVQAGPFEVGSETAGRQPDAGKHKIRSYKRRLTGGKLGCLELKTDWTGVGSVMFWQVLSSKRLQLEALVPH